MSRSKFLPILVGAAVLTIAGVAALPAHANLILVEATPAGVVPAPSVAASFTDLGSQGFGTAPRMLTLQTNTVETGSVTPVDVPNGDAVPGANKSTTPTLATLGWTNGSQVGIGFNSDQAGQTGITMQSLTLTIFNGTTALGSFSLGTTGPSAAPITFTAADLALQQGNGNAVFDFGLTPAEQAQFNTIAAMTGSSGFFAGLSSQLGCPAGAPTSCLPSNDGPDTYIGFTQVPAPFIGHGLLVLLAVSGVLFGGKLLENLKKRHFRAA
jgi:hypothetical protein